MGLFENLIGQPHFLSAFAHPAIVMAQILRQEISKTKLYRYEKGLFLVIGRSNSLCRGRLHGTESRHQHNNNIGS